MYSWQIDQLITARCGMLRSSEFELITDKNENPNILSVQQSMSGGPLYKITTDDGYNWAVYVYDGNQ